jgi:hypothetical protein
MYVAGMQTLTRSCIPLCISCTQLGLHPFCELSAAFERDRSLVTSLRTSDSAPIKWCKSAR